MVENVGKIQGVFDFAGQVAIKEATRLSG